MTTGDETKREEKENEDDGCADIDVERDSSFVLPSPIPHPFSPFHRTAYVSAMQMQSIEIYGFRSVSFCHHPRPLPPLPLSHISLSLSLLFLLITPQEAIEVPQVSPLGLYLACLKDIAEIHHHHHQTIVVSSPPLPPSLPLLGSSMFESTLARSTIMSFFSTTTITITYDP